MRCIYVKILTDSPRCKSDNLQSNRSFLGVDTNFLILHCQPLASYKMKIMYREIHQVPTKIYVEEFLESEALGLDFCSPYRSLLDSSKQLYDPGSQE